ncbi:DUF742 domain-containing protein [Streptomyces sulfonofaciens]|uniref:DUF742 domain-containing protein n=1 Tax=Streptomyces sulfonofaciens TaxID=68272 RepID=UPI00167B9BE2|nr:DUF742 domain-containing protein [Streptomyces sulfonofaciens]
MAAPRDGSGWPYSPAQGQDDGMLDPYSPPSAPSGGYAPRQPHLHQSPAPVPYEQPRPRIQTVEPLRRPDEPESAPAGASGDHPLVRPYTMTGGRTRPRYQLALEALVSTSATPLQVQGQLPEHQRICGLCQEIKSVAEISALLTIPLGVARILVADLAEAGLVAIHQPGGDENAGGQPDVTLLERVLSGLRKL